MVACDELAGPHGPSLIDADTGDTTVAARGNLVNRSAASDERHCQRGTAIVRQGAQSHRGAALDVSPYR